MNKRSDTEYEDEYGECGEYGEVVLGHCAIPVQLHLMNAASVSTATHPYVEASDLKCASNHKREAIFHRDVSLDAPARLGHFSFKHLLLPWRPRITSQGTSTYKSRFEP